MKGSALLGLVVLAASGTTAVAEPAFAVRTGYRCSQCHTNRTGGGMRTSFGSIWLQTSLPNRQSWRQGLNPLPADPEARWAIGGDARFQFVGLNPRGAESSSSLEIAEANAYVEARIVPNRLSLYLDERTGPEGASARELFALFGLRRANAYVKVGKLLPAYGWRLPDDRAFIRQFSGFSYASPDLGLEVGFEPRRWSLHLSATNGAGGGGDIDGSKRLTLQTARRFRRARIGLSASHNIAGGARTSLAGIWGGANFGRLAVLAEGDVVEVRFMESVDRRWLGLIEADLLVIRGLTVKLARDWIDPDRNVSTDARVRDSLGLEYVPLPFVQLRWFGRVGDGPPQVPGSKDKQVELELHLFF